MKTQLLPQSPLTQRRLVELVTVLHKHIVGGASEISFSALLGDDDEWTIRQEVQNLYNLTHPK